MTVPLVRPGQKITAAQQNLVADTINRVALKVGISTSGVGTLRGNQQSMVASAVNIGTVTLLPEQVVTVKGEKVGVDPRSPVVTVSASGQEGESDLMAVVMEVIAPNAIGKVMIQGVTWATANGTTGAFARPLVGALALTLGSSGPAQVLGGSGTTRVLIRFPTGAGSGSGAFVTPTGWHLVGG